MSSQDHIQSLIKEPVLASNTQAAVIHYGLRVRGDAREDLDCMSLTNS